MPTVGVQPVAGGPSRPRGPGNRSRVDHGSKAKTKERIKGRNVVSEACLSGDETREYAKGQCDFGLVPGETGCGLGHLPLLCRRLGPHHPRSSPHVRNINRESAISILGQSS
jgi:hypothetical protein